ncbi:MAG TPA: phosphoglucosamine mutase [Thermoplasmata archaeon]|nr:phosphoglucosamine mutase [Thermoplasmata archaeon]
MSRHAERESMRLFGTNGIREVVGERLTAGFVSAVAGGISESVPPGRPIVVGWDGRTSRPAFARIVISALELGGHTVIPLGILPTPAIQYNLLQLSAQLGVIVTASHNPPEFNGIKLIAEDGLEVTRDVEERVESAAAEGRGPTRRFDGLGDVRPDSNGAHRYIEGILAQVDVASIRRRQFKVVLDCGNGASVPTSPELLRRLGCHVVTLNAQIDGTFPGHRSEPTEANLADLVRTVPAVGADLGIAHDGDADRAVFVDAKGQYLPGERTLTLLARESVRQHHGGIVVTPVSGSQSVEDAVKPLGGEVVYTRVGSPVVTREMRARQAVFGGEENGGLIFPSFQLARDGAMTAAAVLDYLARSGVSLAEAVADLPTYALVKQKVACPRELADQVIGRLGHELESEGVRVLTLDGLKIFRPDGWILLRPSGTEPLIRVFAEAKEAARAEALAEEGIRRVRALIGQLAPSPGAS